MGVDGRLRCLGNKQHLKQKYGKGYTMELSTHDGNDGLVQDWVRKNMPDMTLCTEESQPGHFLYQVQQSAFDLSSGFAAIEAAQQSLGITNFSISQTTLEQVFNRFASDQVQEAAQISEASLEKAVQHNLPSCAGLFCCPGQEYNWEVSCADAPPLQVSVKFNHSSCVCCRGNPGVVTIDNQPVHIMTHDNDLQQVLIEGSTEPGCRHSCCGCASCCGCNSLVCCSELKHTFVAHGHVFELVPFSEVPCTSHAQPCMLFVDGLEVESGVKRNDYLKIVFHNACFKYFCIVGIPMFVITAMLISTSAQSGSFFSTPTCRHCANVPRLLLYMLHLGKSMPVLSLQERRG